MLIRKRKIANVVTINRRDCLLTYYQQNSLIQFFNFSCLNPLGKHWHSINACSFHYRLIAHKQLWAMAILASGKARLNKTIVNNGSTSCGEHQYRADKRFQSRDCSFDEFFKYKSILFIMYSDSQSVRQTFAFPPPEIPSVRGRNSGKSLSRPPHDANVPIKDQLYFKLKVLKHVGQLVSNLKSSIALFTHDLSEQQLSYLESTEDACQSQSLLRQDNFLILLAELALWLLLWITLWKCSFEMVFEKVQSSSLINILTVVIYACYLVVYFNSKLRNQRQELITVRSVIAKDYLVRRFPQLLPFFIANFIEIAVQPEQGSNLYYLTRLIPLTLFTEISILYKNLENAISSENKGEILLMFAKMLGKIMLFLHLISLLLNATRNLEFQMGASVTWVEQYRPDEVFSSSQQYLLGWYWASTILCTVGFGDIVPIDNLERGVISFIEVFSALIFGYFVNYIGSLIKMQGEKTDMFETNLRRLNRYLSKTKIPGELKREARAHIFDREEIVKTYNQEQEEEVLGNLKSQIKNDILEYSNLQILKTAAFAKFLSSELLKKVAYKMHKLISAPEQTIYSPEDKYAGKLWVVEKGKIVDRWYASGKLGKDIAIYTHDAHENVLGWINFIKEEAYRLTAKCEAFSILHEINREDFMAIVKQSRLDYLKLMEYKDQMIFMGKKYVPRCLCCKRLSHSTIDCPKIHMPKRSAHFLFGRLKSEALFAQTNKRSKKKRNHVRYHWHKAFDHHQLDPNANNEEQMQIESSGNIPMTSRVNSLKRMQQNFKRPSVDEVLQFVKKCSMHLIQKEEVTTNKRLSTKLQILSECASNKNLNSHPPLTESQLLKNFDKHLPDEAGYFEQANYARVLQKHLEAKSQTRKLRL